MTIFASRTFKRTAALLLCTVSLALPALAQNSSNPEGGPPPGRGPGRGGMRMNPEERLARLKTELNLSEDQVAKIKAIFEEGRAKMQAERKSDAAPEDRRGAMMADMKVEREKIAAVLNADQKAKFEEMEARMRRGGPRGPGGNGDGPPPPPPPQ